MKHILRPVIVAGLLCWSVAAAQTDDASVDPTVDSAAVQVPAPVPASVTALAAEDKPNDHGHAIDLSWQLSADDISLEDGAQTVLQYEVFNWVPYYFDTLTYMREQFQLARDGANPALADGSKIQSALSQIESGVIDPGSLDYMPQTPPDFSEASDPGALLKQLLEDSLAVLQSLEGVPKDSARTLRKAFESAMERLPEAFNGYPNGGRWLLLGTSSSSSSHTHLGSRDEFSPTFVPDYADMYYRVDAVTAEP
ncbi:MAG: hypothetical protein V3T31_02330, partial [candidate division Zixibacteria bacterium]